MKKLNFLLTAILLSAISFGQTTPKELPFKWDELTSPQFLKAVEKAGGVAVIPFGIMEKHGPHLPLGTDLFEAREIVTTALKKEYAIMFPPYFTGQIFEAKHQPGTVAYSNDLMWKMLEETCAELSRNGLKKIVILNGHGGNTNFLHYFCQCQLQSRKDYILVLFEQSQDATFDNQIKALKKANVDDHAGEGETCMMYCIRPDLVDVDAISSQSGLSQERLSQMKNGYTGIWWYAKYPNHYGSDQAVPNKALGQLLIDKEATQLAGLIKYLKANNKIEELQNEFYNRSANPLGK
ncbi:MAG TPA: creatininase family protein [Bacteroidales bacterium]|nr:creatininase family protein [Bacteroidales bacterium]